MAQICPAKSTIVPFKKQMYSSGSIILSYKDDKCICVSIHAPTRGATVGIVLLKTKRGFNPRTHEGCDQLGWDARQREYGFNPRTHEGCDLNNDDAYYSIKVSIHAPTRGATLELPALSLNSLVFQSTHPRGVRPKI